MLPKWPIRSKFLFGLGLLLLLVVILSAAGLYGTFSYRSLVKSLSWRAEELPVAAELSRQVGQLRTLIGELRGLQAIQFPETDPELLRMRMASVREQFRAGLSEVEHTLDVYRRQLERKCLADSRITDTQREWRTVHKIETALDQTHRLDQEETWVIDQMQVGRLDEQLEELQQLTAELPSHLHERLRGFAAEVRSQYRLLIVGTGIVGVLAAVILGLFVRLAYRWVFEPLQVLINGSRRVASGRFNYRIRLDTRDEMAELAQAMNAMTARFEAIRDDLDRQVRERTRQVVRSEQLASVGFLAAGVAHEINNPLASIAMCAEAMEDRLQELRCDDEEEHKVLAQYLQMIQTEAFRCKEITERLLDFSRIGHAEHEPTELGELVRGVIAMVAQLGKYQKKHIEFHAAGPVVAPVNPQEIKQVVLNLLTNALESLDEEGTVRIVLSRKEDYAELVFRDNGCGMSAEVLQHAFEPFFTRRPGGQGTGLGLSITHQIVTDHGGQIDAHSDGPGTGSTFRVRLPLVENHERRPRKSNRPVPSQTAVC